MRNDTQASGSSLMGKTTRKKRDRETPEGAEDKRERRENGKGEIEKR